MNKFVKLLFVMLSIALCVGCDSNRNPSYSKPSYSVPPLSVPSIPEFSFPSFDFDFDFDVGINEDYIDSSTDNYNEHYDYIVYVSRAGKIHRISYCSGMKYYTIMSFYEARSKGYVLCQNCY